ncbi:hypothetical protein ACWA5Z_10005 [Testudinibacter sp. P80/BLE/0925]|uniref:hypothetical protein n=1 Tax=Testudinibacter sp. TW-1 TaxID=3417757 RepID=UPI003D365BBF
MKKLGLIINRFSGLMLIVIIMLVFFILLYLKLDAINKKESAIEYKIECYSNGNVFMSDIGKELVRLDGTYTYVSIKIGKTMIIPQNNCILSYEKDYK